MANKVNEENLNEWAAEAAEAGRVNLNEGKSRTREIVMPSEGDGTSKAAVYSYGNQKKKHTGAIAAGVLVAALAAGGVGFAVGGGDNNPISNFFRGSAASTSAESTASSSADSSTSASSATDSSTTAGTTASATSSGSSDSDSSAASDSSTSSVSAATSADLASSSSSSESASSETASTGTASSGTSGSNTADNASQGSTGSGSTGSGSEQTAQQAPAPAAPETTVQPQYVEPSAANQQQSTNQQQAQPAPQQTQPTPAPEPTPAPTPEPAPQQQSGGFHEGDPFWGVWVGSFKEKANAEERLQEMRNLGYPDPRMYWSQDYSGLNQEGYWVVAAGIYDSESNARYHMDKAASAYPDTYVKYSGTHN